MTELFIAFVMGHIIFDWLLQTDWMALNKSKGGDALAIHSTVYAIGVYVFGMLATALQFEFRLSGIVVSFVLFATHMFLDDYKFHSWWKRNVKCMTRQRDLDTQWMTICIDQCWHILILWVIAVLITLK